MVEPNTPTEPPSTNVRFAGAADQPAIARLCWAYRAELVARNADLPDIVEAYYAEARFADTINMLPALHSRPDGLMFVATLSDAVVGCAMTTRRSDEVCEIKRIFVAHEARGFGLAKRLIRVAMQFSRLDGYKTMVLDTMRSLTEAIALYEHLGFQKASPFYKVDPRFSERIQFYEIRL